MNNINDRMMEIMDIYKSDKGLERTIETVNITLPDPKYQIEFYLFILALPTIVVQAIRLTLELIRLQIEEKEIKELENMIQ